MTFKKAIDILKTQKMQQKSIKAAWICHLAQKEIDEEFGSKKIFAGSFKNETLTLNVPNSILAGEVRLKSEELKKKINQKLKKELVERIRTKIS